MVLVWNDQEGALVGSCSKSDAVELDEDKGSLAGAYSPKESKADAVELEQSDELQIVEDPPFDRNRGKSFEKVVEIVDSEVDLPTTKQQPNRGIGRRYYFILGFVLFIHSLLTLLILIAFWVEEAGWNIAVSAESCTRISMICTLYFFGTMAALFYSYFLFLDFRKKYPNLDQSVLYFSIVLLFFVAMGVWTISDSLTLDRRCRTFIKTEGSAFLLSSYELYGWWHLIMYSIFILTLCFKPTLLLHRPWATAYE